MNEQKIELDIVLYPEGTEELKIYNIWCLQVPNVVTQGRTIEEAKKRLKEALELYFEEVPTERGILVQKVAEENNTPLISRIFL